MTLEITRFRLPSTPALADLRGSIWERVFVLYKNVSLRDDVLRLFETYCRGSGLRSPNPDILATDADYLLDFLNAKLYPEDYRACRIMHGYLDLLEAQGVEFPVAVRTKFETETHKLAEVLLPYPGSRRALDLDYEQYEEHKRRRLDEATAGYGRDDFIRFFERCREIGEALGDRPHEYQLHWGVVHVLSTLADRNKDVFGDVLREYLSLGDPFGLNGRSLVKKLLAHRGYREAAQLLSSVAYPTQASWLFFLLEVLPAEEISADEVARLYDLYEEAPLGSLPHRTDFLLKYRGAEPTVVPNVVELVLTRTAQDSRFTLALSMLFNPYSEIAKDLGESFNGAISALKRAYLAVESTGERPDFHGQAFGQILDLDKDFGAEYVRSKYESAEHGWLSSHDDSRDYAFLWERSDHQEVVDGVVQAIYACESEGYRALDPYLATFFNLKNKDGEEEQKLRGLQDAYLMKKLEERIEDAGFVEHIFQLIATFPSERRLVFVEQYVNANSDFEAFQRLSLEPNGWGTRGSWVPVLQRRIQFWESLRDIMTGVDLLPHRQFAERKLQHLRAEVRRESKRDFMGWH